MPQAIKLIDAEGRSCIYAPITQNGKVVAQGMCLIWRINDRQFPRVIGFDRRSSNRTGSFGDCPMEAELFL